MFSLMGVQLTHMNSGPETKPTLDRSTLLPILLGGFSLLGILIVFVIGRINSGRSAVPTEDTATPFKYQLIGTEPGISTAEFPEEEPGSLDGSSDNGSSSNGSGSPGLVVTAQQGASSGSGSSSSNNPTKTKTSSSVIQTVAGNATDPIIILNPGTKSATPEIGIIERTPTRSRTPGPTITLTPSRTKNVTSTAPTISTTETLVALTPGTYDDSHPLIAYNGWNIITDASAYQSTLHISSTAGSTVTFGFTGQQIRITFQDSASFGTIRISIGGLNFDLDESNGTNEWVSALLAQGTYTVVITHASGGSVNIDSIIIPDFTTTATPPTPTSTSAPGAP